jgi:hypothetical protein
MAQIKKQLNEDPILKSLDDKLRALGAVPSSVSLNLPDGITFEEWKEVGKILNEQMGYMNKKRRFARQRDNMNWWYGDWWNAGEKFQAIAKASAKRR